MKTTEYKSNSSEDDDFGCISNDFKYLKVTLFKENPDNLIN